MAGLESFDVRQLKLWRQQILDIYEYQLMVAMVRDFLEDLDRFRMYSWRYVGRVAEQLYRDVKEVIDGVFNVSEVVEG